MAFHLLENPPTTGGVLDIRNAPYLFTCYPSPNPSPRLLRGGGSTYHAVIRRRFTKSVHCAGLRNSVCQKHWGVRFPGCTFASLAAPAAHRQHHLHHPHQRLPRMRMMQVMLGMLPMLVNPPPSSLLSSFMILSAHPLWKTSCR